MCMGLGCNAAGVTGCRIIDSPRERLIAILTNSFVPCNGRFPTMISLIAMFFVGAGGGWGRRFVAFAEGLAAGRGCRAMRLDTYEGNAPAAAFYQKLGYRLAGETEFFFEGFRREILICFEKDLTKR